MRGASVGGYNETKRNLELYFGSKDSSKTLVSNDSIITSEQKAEVEVKKEETAHSPLVVQKKEQTKDSYSTEAQEKKDVSSQELRNQILDSFIEVLYLTGKDDQYIKNIIFEINKVLIDQKNFIEVNLNEKRIIREELGEGVDKSFKDEIKTLLQKYQKLTTKYKLILQGMELSKVNLGQKEIEIKINKLKEDLDSKLNKLNKLNLREQEELADKVLKNFLTDYFEVEKNGEKNYLALLRKLPIVIRNVLNAITTDNEEKMKGRIKALGELGEEIMGKEIIKCQTEYEEGGETNYELLKKLPKLINYCSNAIAGIHDKNGGIIRFDKELRIKIKEHRKNLIGLIEEIKDDLEMTRPSTELGFDLKGEGSVIANNTSRGLLGEFQEKGSDKKIDEDKRDKEFQEDFEKLEDIKLGLERIRKKLSDKKFTEYDLEKLGKTIEQLNIYNDIFIKQILNKYGIDSQAVRSPEDKTISQQRDNQSPRAPTLLPISSNSPKSPPAPNLLPIYSNSPKSPRAPTLLSNSYKSPLKNSQTAIPQVCSPQPLTISTFPIVFYGSYGNGQVVDNLNSSNLYSDNTRGPDVYSQVPIGSVQFVPQQPPSTTITPNKYVLQRNITSRRVPFPDPYNSRSN